MDNGLPTFSSPFTSIINFEKKKKTNPLSANSNSTHQGTTIFAVDQWQLPLLGIIRSSWDQRAQHLRWSHRVWHRSFQEHRDLNCSTWEKQTLPKNLQHLNLAQNKLRKGCCELWQPVAFMTMDLYSCVCFVVLLGIHKRWFHSCFTSFSTTAKLTCPSPNGWREFPPRNPVQATWRSPFVVAWDIQENPPQISPRSTFQKTSTKISCHKISNPIT